MLAATVLLALVALGSRAVPFPPGAGERSTTERSDPPIAYLGVLVVPASIAGIAILAAILMPQGRSEGEADRRLPSLFGSMRWWMRATAVVGFIAAVAVPLAFAMWGAGEGLPARPSISGPRPASGSTVPQPSAASTEATRRSWVAIAVAVAAGGGLALAGSLAARRGSDRTRVSRSAVEALRRVLVDSVADLRAEADPRRAVVAAYARMEHDLTGVGLPRRPSETAPEYLRRLLVRSPVSRDAAARLTELFQRAKFGGGSVGADTKDEAIACLERVAAEIGGA